MLVMGFGGVVRALGLTYSILYVEVIKKVVEVDVQKLRGQRRKSLRLWKTV